MLTHQVIFITALTFNSVLMINTEMTNEADNANRPAGFEEPFVVYERARRQKHGPDDLSALETLVLRRVVVSGCLEQETLRPQVGRSSLSRVLARLTKRNLVKSTIDSRDRRRHVLYPTGPGQRLLAKIDAAHAANLNASVQVQPEAPAPSAPERTSSGPVSTDSRSAEAKPTSKKPGGSWRKWRRRGLRQIRTGPGQLPLDLDDFSKQAKI